MGVESSPRRPELGSSEIVVFDAHQDWTCAVCGDAGSRFLRKEDRGALCLDCADLGALEYLPAGDAALTRRAKAASRLWAVVLRWSRARKRYERQGLLVEPAAVERAEAECLADADARARRAAREAERRAEEDQDLVARMAEAVLRLFPSCPSASAAAIARHTARRGSGRVGRSAAGRALEDVAIELAVVAAVRHEHTRYDDLLMEGRERTDAREEVRDDVQRVLTEWRRAAPESG